MARMYPRTLEEEFVESEAETSLFHTLEEHLDDNWHVFHSVGWVARDHAEGSKDGEIDFVLIHPEKGILCIEVKGGGIECQHGGWYRTGKEGRQRIEDPFKQAEDHEYDLRRMLEQRIGKGKIKDLLIDHCLAFPFVTVHHLVLPPDAPDQILLDLNDLKDPQTAIESVFAYHRGSRDKRVPPIPKLIDEIRQVLAGAVTIQQSLGDAFMLEEEQFFRLTNRQAELMSGLRLAKRVAVQGCAGSGKTMLAVARAKQLAGEGLKVLFLCFNRALRFHLMATAETPGIAFHTFHSLCWSYAEDAGLELSDYGNNAPSTFYSEELPDALIEALDVNGTRFDALLIDEAQDFDPEWYERSLLTLHDESDAFIWIYLDANQRIFDPKFTVPSGFTPYELTDNCRNTKAIHEELLTHFEGDVTPRAIGPDGRQVERIQTDDQPAAVRDVLQRLTEADGILPQDVVVLSPHSCAKSSVGRAGGGKFDYIDRRAEPLENEVRFSSIRAFKGLEAPVIVACELENLPVESAEQQEYVAFSRARNHLVIVTSDDRVA